mmetsp:Transcript_41553/g.138186  ORF Transcript_41553/g.138186 Transcript_41553/m.138186 type:complete len:266 (-) Transcript_41553:115-912(-)
MLPERLERGQHLVCRRAEVDGLHAVDRHRLERRLEEHAEVGAAARPHADHEARDARARRLPLQLGAQRREDGLRRGAAVMVAVGEQDHHVVRRGGAARSAFAQHDLQALPHALRNIRPALPRHRQRSHLLGGAELRAQCARLVREDREACDSRGRHVCDECRRDDCIALDDHTGELRMLWVWTARVPQRTARSCRKVHERREGLLRRHGIHPHRPTVIEHEVEGEITCAAIRGLACRLSNLQDVVALASKLEGLCTLCMGRAVRE